MARARSVFFEIQQPLGFVKDLVDASKELRERCAQVNRETAVNITHRARQLAPDDPRTTPDLKSTINFEGKGLSWKVGIEDRSFHGRGGDLAHQSPWVYGPWYEYGFKSLNIQTTPYMRPAADAEDASHQERMTEAINASLNGND